MNRKAAIAFFGALILCVLAAAGFFLFSVLNQPDLKEDGEQVHRPERQQISFEGKNYIEKEDLETVLFIGLDGVTTEEKLSYNNQVQSDFVTMILVDHKRKRYDILQLNRDTICDIPVLDTRGNQVSTEKAQLALAHTYGSGSSDSCRNVSKAVTELLYGAKVDHFFSISIHSISVLNDILGGVTVTLEDDFSGSDPEMVPGKTIRLMGDQAEIYVRRRKDVDDSSNLSRMRRQKNYMEKWTEKAREILPQSSNLLSDALLRIGDDLVSDMSVYVLSDLVNNALTYEAGEIITPEGKVEMLKEHMAFYADEDQLMKMVVDLFCEEK